MTQPIFYVAYYPCCIISLLFSVFAIKIFELSGDKRVSSPFVALLMNIAATPIFILRLISMQGCIFTQSSMSATSISIPK